MAIGIPNIIHGFKLNALHKEDHTHHFDNTIEIGESDIRREAAFGFEDDIDPIIVDSPPPGVNFTDCVVDLTTGYCCIDFVCIFK